MAVVCGHAEGMRGERELFKEFKECAQLKQTQRKISHFDFLLHTRAKARLPPLNALKINYRKNCINFHEKKFIKFFIKNIFFIPYIKTGFLK
jgi:hypothetical protein